MCRRVAAQLVGDEPTGKTPLLLQQLSKEPDRRSSIPSRLDEDVQHVAILIHGSPQVLFPASDRHEELVEMPRVAQPAAPAPERAGIAQAERQAPLANRLVGDRNVPLGQEVFDITETQAEAKVDPNGVGRAVSTPLRQPDSAFTVAPQAGDERGRAIVTDGL